MKLNFLCNDGWTSNHKLFCKGHHEAVQAMATVYKGAGRICRKIGITVEKVCN
jgi:formamidopyrimidine-DNA glycosylase